MAHGGLHLAQHVAGSCPKHRWERLQVMGQQAGGAGGRLRQALLRWLGCDLRLAAVGALVAGAALRRPRFAANASMAQWFARSKERKPITSNRAQ